MENTMDRTKEELELLNKFHLKDFRELKTEHALALMSSLKDLSPEIQSKIIEQIPNFTNYLLSSINICKEELNNILSLNNESLNECFSSYNLIIDNLQKVLENDECLTFEQKMQIIDNIGSFADKKVELHIQDQKFKTNIFNKFLGVACVGVVGLFALFGCNLAMKSNDDDEYDDEYNN